jgi:dienelactone hydrolase
MRFFKSIVKKIHGSELRRLGATTLTLVLLTGCASHSPPKPDEGKVKQFAGQGYLTDDHYAVTTTFATWEMDDSSFDVALTLPAKPGPFPLVIYLPALGETRSAGDAWRSAWAQGGYAVVSIQLLREDATAWSSARARMGDFSVLARERYSGEAMAARLEALRAVLTELIRRHDRRDAPLDRIDLSRTAVAGFDLGAYTAMVIAGESSRGAVQPSLQIPIKAVIALSPYADFSGAPFGERYKNTHGPILSITSDNDGDALGVVPSPSVRRAPFEYMPRGDKYLLTLSDIPHRTLAGGEIKQDPEENRSPENAKVGSNDPQGSGRRGGRRKGGGNAGGSSNGDKGEHGRSESMGKISPTAQAIGVIAIQGVTTAFLDAYVKNDPIAREWLDKDASRWIKDRGEIRKK